MTTLLRGSRPQRLMSCRPAAATPVSLTSSTASPLLGAPGRLLVPFPRLGARSLHARRAAAASADPSAPSAQPHFTVTTPLYYVNAAPHMGSAYPTIAADALARFHRMTGKRVKFITGTDEHGEKIQLAAEKRGMTPQAHCDDIVRSYQDLWAKLDIKYDSFIRTTDKHHEGVVTQVLSKVWERGDIYKAKYEGFYCVGCEEYKDEKEMDETKNCPVHRTPCQHRSEENYFFKLSAYQQRLEDFLTANPDFVQPPSRRNEVLGWVKDGVRDFSISRSKVEWGIPILQDPVQTVYVWFDALNGYLSGLYKDADGAVNALATAQDAPSHGWPASVHIIGKDILRFHAVYWPAMLMSAGLPLPEKVFGHGFLTKDGLKMGKSLGNVLEPEKLVGAYGADAVRLYFMSMIPFGSDGDFSEARFRDEVNARLANDVGNLLNRSLNLLGKNAEGMAPVAAAAIPPEHPLRQLVDRNVPLVAAAFESMRLEQALALAFEISGRGNLEMNVAEPWKKLKGTEEERAEALAFLVATLESVRIVAALISPVVPGVARKIYLQLGFSEAEFEGLRWAEATRWGAIGAGHRFAEKPEPVFVRLEGDFVCDAAPGAAAPAAKGAGGKGTGQPKQPKQPKEKKLKVDAEAPSASS